MERYLVELTGNQLDRLNGMVREQSAPPRTKASANSPLLVRRRLGGVWW
jgi:hypothetical protein